MLPSVSVCKKCKFFEEHHPAENLSTYCCVLKKEQSARKTDLQVNTFAFRHNDALRYMPNYDFPTKCPYFLEQRISQDIEPFTVSDGFYIFFDEINEILENNAKD